TVAEARGRMPGSSSSITAHGRSSPMATDPKVTPANDPILVKGIRVFTYPKLIFIFPTFLTALICGTFMMVRGDNTVDPLKAPPGVVKVEAAPPIEKLKGEELILAKHQRFLRPENLLGVLFLGIFAFNLVIMALDFPRFTL